MKFALLTTFTLLFSSVIAAPPASSPDTSLFVRDASPLENTSPLEKRKGGGGGRGGGGGSSSSGGGSRGSGSGGGSSRPLSSYSFSPQSSTGGRTISGSGTRPAYGNRYAGGAAVPYTAGSRSPTRRVAPFALPIAGLAIFPGLWLYGSLYAYPYYGYPYYWNENGQNRTSNVTCLCQRYQVCGCDPTDNQTLLRQQIAGGNMDGVPVNSSTVRTVKFDNGTTASYINGSLANGTTAPGGTEPSSESGISAGVELVMGYGGYWLMVAAVLGSVYMV